MGFSLCNPGLKPHPCFEAQGLTTGALGKSETVALNGEMDQAEDITQPTESAEVKKSSPPTRLPPLRAQGCHWLPGCRDAQ